MRSIRSVLAVGIVTVVALLGVAPAAQAATAFMIDGFPSTLVRFDTATPGTVTAIGPVTGLQAELIVGMDFRPLNGELYALTNASRLYKINTATAAATQVGSDGAFTLNGGFFAFDFNPAVDRIRVVSDVDQNLRLNPFNGTLASTDTSVAYDALDPNVLDNPAVVGLGYDRNFAGTPATSLFGVDFSPGRFVRQGSVDGTPSSPNNGKLFTIGALGANLSNSGLGFDIASDGTAFLAARSAGNASLFTVNTATGAATLVGPIGPTPATSFTEALAVRIPATLDHDSLTFGPTPVGATSAPQTLEFTNRGPDNAFNLTLTGTHAGDFTIIHDGCAVSELASGDDCEVTVAFKPTAAIPSARLATLTFAREGGGNVLVPLTGTATAPVITPPVTPPVPLCRGDAATVTGSGTITGTPGSDVIVGSLGPDTISGGGGDDTICPLDGDDSVNGGGGEDVVRAGAGNDSLRGGRGKDRLAGRAGDDSLKGGSGADRCDGGAGTDTAKACEKLFSIP